VGADGAEPSSSTNGSERGHDLSVSAAASLTLAPFGTEDREPGAGVFPERVVQPPPERIMLATASTPYTFQVFSPVTETLADSSRRFGRNKRTAAMDFW
jgi:hypothetical protein